MNEPLSMKTSSFYDLFLLQNGTLLCRGRGRPNPERKEVLANWLFDVRLRRRRVLGSY